LKVIFGLYILSKLFITAVAGHASLETCSCSGEWDYAWSSCSRSCV